MIVPANDTRSSEQRALDEQIASEPPLAPPPLPPEVAATPVETQLRRIVPRPFAIAGIVEDGVVRPLDPTIHLPEHSRVIIVAAQ
jgi:hypothetical protein